jgi:hypothetical protein
MRSTAVICLVCLLSLPLPSLADGNEPTFVYEEVVTGYPFHSGRGMAVDPDGNAYIFGRVYDDYTANDVIVHKLDPSGTVLWTVYIDANDHDYAEDIVLDPDNNVYITGWTDSDDFPLVNPLDDSLTGFREAFVMKLASSDGEILYSTLLGGDYTDQGGGITLNDAGEIYVVGVTGSTDFPTTPDAYQDHPSAPLYIYTDAFITIISSVGDSILYSTYFGGFEDDWADFVALDQDENIVLAGRTTADSFPVVNPVQSGPHEIFISKLSADGSALMFSTYFGGSDVDGIGGMTLDQENFVYISGSTRSTDILTTPGAYEETFVGAILDCEEGFPGVDVNCFDIFVAKMATDGSGLVYCTYLGGTEDEMSRDITVDSAGCAYVAGYTNSDDYPPSGTTFSAEIVLSKFNPQGSELLYSATVPSGWANSGHGIAAPTTQDVYVTGSMFTPSGLYAARLYSEGFFCGDVNGDWEITTADGFHLLNYFGSAASPPVSLHDANVNSDGNLSSADAYHLLNYLGSAGSLSCGPVGDRVVESQ